MHLGPDLTGDGRPDVAVGSVGSTGTFVSVVSGADGAPMASLQLAREVGFPDLRVVITDGLLRGGAPALIASDPDDGFKVYVLAEGAAP